MRVFIIAAIFLGLSAAPASAAPALFLKGCKAGVAATQAYFKKKNKKERKEIQKRCLAGWKDEKIQTDFNNSSSDESKAAFACGGGMSLAASFYDRKEDIKKADVQEAIAKDCFSHID